MLLQILYINKQVRKSYTSAHNYIKVLYILLINTKSKVVPEVNSSKHHIIMQLLVSHPQSKYLWLFLRLSSLN